MSKLHISIVKIKITFSLRNSHVTISDVNGNILCHFSSGKLGFKGSRRGSSFASEVVLNNVIRYCMANNIVDTIVVLSGVGKGRKTVNRILKSSSLNILYIKDTTSTPFNGCRPPSLRRI
uniref:Ribosomal protein S11 n=1 Tax=Imasa heleensis TaxID=2772037 RepID=A0A893DCX5_9EUKA|nr:ribosomal protein S11 [Imasa heleensis]QRR29735.1 ribosomal protein S11 [Imasa heleensis]